MSIPQLETCCCGCSLRTGTKIIAWLSLISGIIFLITFGSVLATLYYVEGHPEVDTEDVKEIREFLPVFKFLAVSFIVVGIFHSALAFILLLGVYQNKAKFVLYWVMVALTLALVSLALKIGYMLISFQTYTLTITLGLFIHLYFILVVYSFYREINTVSNKA